MRNWRLVQAGFRGGQPPLIAIYESKLDFPGEEEPFVMQVCVKVEDIKSPDSRREIAVWLETARQELDSRPKDSISEER